MRKRESWVLVFGVEVADVGAKKILVPNTALAVPAFRKVSRALQPELNTRLQWDVNFVHGQNELTDDIKCSKVKCSCCVVILFVAFKPLDVCHLIEPPYMDTFECGIVPAAFAVCNPFLRLVSSSYDPQMFYFAENSLTTSSY